MTEARKVAAILVTDIVGFSRLVGTDEEGTLARLRALQSELIDPTVAVHGGRIVKRTGDGAIVEFRSVVEAVRCAAEVRDGLAVRNADLPADQRIEVRTGIHLGDVVEEADGDLMGDGVNIAARLEGVATAGGIYLSEDAYRQVRNKIKADFIDLGEKELKNIVQRIRVYAVKNDSGDAATPVASLECRATPRLSIVVLPFSNIGDDPAQDYFVNGVTESLTTDLSRISGAFVIGRHTAFTYKDKQVDLKQVGRELNVRYVLEGSVQRGGNRMRINAQLVDAETGAHLWAERFDKPVADLFEMQDEIVARLARQLDAALIAAEARRAERAPRPSSMDLFFQGMRSLNRGVTPSNLTEAVSFFEGALAADPDNVDALAWLAAAYAQFAGGLSIDDRAVPIAAAEAAATKALYLAPEHPMAHLAMSIVYGVSNSNRLEMAIAECAAVSRSIETLQALTQ